MNGINHLEKPSVHEVAVALPVMEVESESPVTVTAPPIAQAEQGRFEKIYKNVGSYILVMMLVVLWGFYRSYFGKALTITMAHHFHALMMLVWFTFLIVQPFLIATKKIRLHKLIGKASMFFAPFVMLSIFFVSKGLYHRMGPKFPREETVGILAIDVPFIFAFGFFYIMALVYKKTTAYHMRYMIATSLLMLVAGLVRIFINYFGVRFDVSFMYSMFIVEAIIVALLTVDIAKRNVTRPYTVTLITFIFCHLIWHFHLSWWWQAIGSKWAEVFY